MKWNYKDLQNSKGKKYMLRFLPYLETRDGRPVETVIGYAPAGSKRGFGYGRWEEFFNTLAQAKKRMKFLFNSKAVEDCSLYEDAKNHNFGRLVDEWGR